MEKRNQSSGQDKHLVI